MASDRRQQRDLEDAAFTVEQQHKAVMDETHRLYTEIITSYQSAHHCWVPTAYALLLQSGVLASSV